MRSKDVVEYAQAREPGKKEAQRAMADERSMTGRAPAQRPAAPQRTVSGEEQGGEKQIDHALRPRSLKEMIGQDRLREKIQVLVDAARQRGDALDHVLLYGPPGL